MGVEYRITCGGLAIPKIREWLLKQGGKSDQGKERFDFQLEDTTGADSMPDATICLEPEGLYMLIYGGSKETAGLFFRKVIDQALLHSTESDSVTLTAL